MAIVCVTNLSPESLAAAHVAAAVAGRRQEPLLLLGVAGGDAFLENGTGARALPLQRLEEDAAQPPAPPPAAPRRRPSPRA